jgi:hypothetical protein
MRRRPNTVVPSRCDKDFLALLPNGLRGYVEDDRNVTILMLAAGLGQVDYLRPLIVQVPPTRLSGRNKMSALDVAAETGHSRSAQILLGGGPPPDQLRLEISLALQRVALVKNVCRYIARNVPRAGQVFDEAWRIRDYEQRAQSPVTIYHVEMPYFMRLSCLDFGMHAGYVPNYPTSRLHPIASGCCPEVFLRNSRRHRRDGAIATPLLRGMRAGYMTGGVFFLNQPVG